MQGEITDPRYPEHIRKKMQLFENTLRGERILIHYWEHIETGARHGFKFK